MSLFIYLFIYIQHIYLYIEREREINMLFRIYWLVGMNYGERFENFYSFAFQQQSSNTCLYQDMLNLSTLNSLFSLYCCSYVEFSTRSPSFRIVGFVFPLTKTHKAMKQLSFSLFFFLFVLLALSSFIVVLHELDQTLKHHSRSSSKGIYELS